MSGERESLEGKNTVMTFLINKRITTELLIDRTSALYIGETPMRLISELTPVDW